MLGFDAHAGVRRVRIQGRGPDGGWETLADASGAALRATGAGIAVKRAPGDRSRAIDQVASRSRSRRTRAKVLTRIAIL